MAIGSKSNRKRPYGMLLLLAFGAAVFGVMILHKLRERRLFNLLIKDKNRELLSLQLLLQKERDVAKEMKGKIEEMKTKSVAVRSQKMWLTNKLTEMQSTIASLRKEQRAMESALKEKDNKINALTDMNAAQGNLQVTTITELLKKKDAIMKEMKRRYEKPTNVWSVSTDDPSNPASNLTVESVPAKDEDNVVVSEDGQTDNAAISQHGEALVKRGEDGDKNTIQGGSGLLKRFEGNQAGEILGGREITGEKNATEGEEKGKYSEGLSKMLEASQSSDGLVRKHWKGPRNVTEGNDQRVISINGQSGVVTVKERGVYRDGKLTKLENAQVGAVKEGIKISNNEKLEMRKHPQNTASSRMRGEYGYRTMAKNNRRRAISTNGESEKWNAQHSENTKLNGESGDRETTEGDSHDVIPRDEDPGKTVNSQGKADSRRSEDGDRSVLGVLLSDDGAVAKNGWLNMPDEDSEGLVMRGEAGDQRTLEGNFDPNDGQQEMPVKSNGEDSRMMTGNENKNATRIGDEETTAVEGIEEQSARRNGQLEIAEHSLVSGKNTSENEKEETSGDLQIKFLRNSQDTDNLRMRKENGDINALEGKESEVVSNDRQLELTANSQGGEQVYNAAFEHQENAILKKQQSLESQNAQEIKAMRIRDDKESENENSQNGKGLTAERENAVLASVASEPEMTGIDSSIKELENLIDAVDDPNIIHKPKFIKKNNRQKRVKKGSVAKARLEN